MRERILTWWDHLSPDARIHHHATALCVALFLFHYAWYSAWFVEDAAITFAYARNAAMGDGFVTYVGGERVEGFSNPTWTVALMLLRLVGIGPWVASKLLGAAFGAATLVVAGTWARKMLPTGAWSALVPLLLAVSPQHVNWCSSGLENAFFGLFLTAGCVRLLQEITEGGRPWSALWFALLAMTRPEAPLYVAVAGLTGWVFAFRMGSRPAMKWALSWGVVLLVPLILWHSWRFHYFAWEFPNTYYAKLGEQERFLPFDWDKRGWAYLRGWFLTHGRGFLLPLFLLGMTGLRGNRGAVGVVLSIITVVLVATGISWPSELMDGERWNEPELLVRGRVVWLAALVLLVPAITVDRDRDLPRVLAWLVGAMVVFFALYSGGDWMRGWRWLSMAIVPLSLLLASGVHAVVTALGPGRPQRALFGVLLAALLIPDAVQAFLLVSRPVTTPYDVHRRVQYMQAIQDRLNLDHATLMDVDMGAHLWWFGPEIVDMAGLVDVPMGHHHWDHAFVEQYVYETRNPTFAHVHASWASRTRMRQHDAWDNYVEVPPFPTSQWSQHDGNHVRGDVFIDPTPRSGGIARFGNAAVLQDFEVPLKSTTPGGELYVELSWRRTARSDGFRAFLFLTNGEHTHIAEVPPGYDYTPFKRWKKGDKYWGRHRVPVPAHLPLGRYDIGLFAVTESEVDEAGQVWPASALTSQAVTSDPRVVPGELRWTRDITLIDREQAVAEYDAALVEVLAKAERGRCDDAESQWRIGRRYLSNSDAHRGRQDVRVRSALASCLALRAPEEAPETAVATLVRARQYDPRNRDLIRTGRTLASQWLDLADAARDQGDGEAELDVLVRVMAADPSRSWTRRRLEAVRAEVLGLNDDEAAAPTDDDDDEGDGGDAAN